MFCVQFHLNSIQKTFRIFTYGYGKHILIDADLYEDSLCKHLERKINIWMVWMVKTRQASNNTKSYICQISFQMSDTTCSFHIEYVLNTESNH
jgi:hypothetical protein